MQTPASTVNYLHPDTAPPTPAYSALSQSGRDTISIGTGGVGVFLPVLSLPQKNGRTLVLGYSYGDNPWTIKQTAVKYYAYSSSADPAVRILAWLEYSANLSYVQNQSGAYNNTLNLNVPSLSADIQYIGADHLGQNTSQEKYVASYCVTNWKFTDWKGTSHSFNGYQDCDDYGNVTIFVNARVLPEALDDSGFHLDTSVPNDLKVTDSDGTVYHFAGYIPQQRSGTGSGGNGYDQLNYYAQKMSYEVDTNGNQITLANGVLTDTVGRRIKIGPNDSSINWVSSGQAASTTLTKTASSQSGSFPSGTLPTCTAKDPSTYSGGVGRYSGWQGPMVSIDQPPPVAASYTDTLTLADGSFYELDYDSTSRLVRIRYPEGGYDRFEYGLWSNSQSATDDGDVLCQRPRFTVVAKHVCTDASGVCTQAPPVTSNSPCVAGSSPGGEQTTCYALGDYGGRVGDPNGRTTDYSFTLGYLDPSNPNPGYQKPYHSPRETRRTVYTLGSTSQIVSQTQTAYASPVGCPTLGEFCDTDTPSVVRTSWYDSSGNSVATEEHDSTFQYPASPKTDVDKDGTGNVLRSSAIVYASGGIYAAASSQNGGLYHLLDRVQSASKSETVTSNSITATNTLDGAGNVIQIDTTATRAPSFSTKVVRDASGQVVQAFDPMQVAGAHAGATAMGYGAQSISGCAFSSVSGLPTSMTDALQHTLLIGYDDVGQRSCIQDLNGNLTKISYDGLGRVTEVDTPDGGRTTANYTAATPITMAVNVLEGPSTTMVADGLGRAYQQTLSGSEGTICTAMFYDSVGNMSDVNDPAYGCQGSPTAGASVHYVYDALDRKTQQVNEDGYAKSWTYNGLQTSTTDENGYTTTQLKDVFGRLSSVVEPTAATTNYTYDGFDNLLSVSQPGLSGEAPRQMRRFSYDALSRLLTAFNPEAGMTCYGTRSGSTCNSGYDLNGNLTAKTDARNIQTSYLFDALNRTTQKSFSGPKAGVVYGDTYCYVYDTIGAATPANAVGRLTAQWTQRAVCPGGSTVPSGTFTLKTFDSYNPLGRVLSEHTCALRNCALNHPQSYHYTLANQLSDYTDGVGAGMVFTQGYDAGRLASLTSNIVDSAHPPLLFQVHNWLPQGWRQAFIGAVPNGTQVTSAAMTGTRTFDSRQRVSSYSVKAGVQ